MKLHFVRSIRGLQNFLVIPIMNTLAGFMIRFVLAIVLSSENNFIIAKLTVWVWCSYNERTNRLRVYRRLLTNRLHGKAAKITE